MLACGRRSGRATSLQLGARLYLVAAAPSASQRSLHNEPIFRLLLKVAVIGTRLMRLHQFLEGFMTLYRQIAANIHNLA